MVDGGILREELTSRCHQYRGLGAAASVVAVSANTALCRDDLPYDPMGNHSPLRRAWSKTAWFWVSELCSRRHLTCCPARFRRGHRKRCFVRGEKQSAPSELSSLLRLRP